MRSFTTRKSPACTDQKFFYAWLTTVLLYKKELPCLNSTGTLPQTEGFATDPSPDPQ